MTKTEQIHNWLTIGFQQPTDKFSEIFYYDKKDNQFFSILITDYFLFDENLNLAKDTTSNYSAATLKVLLDRIKRIENKDITIIKLPRLGNAENSNRKDYISLEADEFIISHSINIETATIWEIEESGTIKINLKD